MPLSQVAGFDVTVAELIDARFLITASANRFDTSYFDAGNTITGLTTFASESQEYFILSDLPNFSNESGWSKIYISDPGGTNLTISGSLFVGSGSEGSITASNDISASGTSSAANFKVANDIELSSNSKIFVGSGITEILANNDDYWVIKANGRTVADFRNSGVIVNDAGHADVDFRVEGDGKTHLLFADAGADKVAIGTDTVSDSLLTVEGDISASETIYTNNLEVATDFTVSGDISASETIYANNLEVATDVSVSGDISASGFLYDSAISTPSLYVAGDISSSANISASGDILAGGATFEGNVDLKTNKLVFDSDATNTFIQANAADPEDLEIHADHDIILKADHETFISSSAYIRGDIKGGGDGVGDFKYIDIKTNLSTHNIIIGHADKSLSFIGDYFNVTPSITASNDISASETIYANNLEVATDFTVSGDISASGLLYEAGEATLLFVEGDISASGDIYGSNFHVNGLKTNTISASLITASTAILGEPNYSTFEFNKGKVNILANYQSEYAGSNQDTSPSIVIQDTKTSINGALLGSEGLASIRFATSDSQAFHSGGNVGNNNFGRVADLRLIAQGQFGTSTELSSALMYRDFVSGRSNIQYFLVGSSNQGLMINTRQDLPSSNDGRALAAYKDYLLTLRGFDGNGLEDEDDLYPKLGSDNPSFLAFRAKSTSGYENYIDITNDGIHIHNNTGTATAATQKPFLKLEGDRKFNGDEGVTDHPVPTYSCLYVKYNRIVTDGSSWAQNKKHAAVSIELSGSGTQEYDGDYYDGWHTNPTTPNYLAPARFISFINQNFGGPGGCEVASIRLMTDANATFVQNSDKRLKTNIQKTKWGLNDLLDIKVKDFEWKDNPNKTVDTGFIAQDLHKVYPGAVIPGDSSEVLTPSGSAWQVSKASLVPLLVQSIQDQQKLIENLQQEIDNLKNKIK